MNKAEIIKYLKTHTMDVQSAIAAFGPMELVFNAYAHSSQLHKIKFSPILIAMDYRTLNRGYQLISEKLLHNVALHNYQTFLKDRSSIDRKLSNQDKLNKEIDKIWQNYNKRLKEINPEGLLVILRKLITLNNKWWHYSSYVEDKGKIIDNVIVPDFSKRNRIEINKAKEIIDILSHPRENTIINNARIDFLSLCLLVINKYKIKKFSQIDIAIFNKDKQLFDRISKYIEKYYWMETDFYLRVEISHESVVKNILKEIKKRGANGLFNELAEIKKNYINLRKKQKNLLKTYKFSEKDKEDIEFASKIIFWIDWRKEGMMKIFYFLFCLYENIVEIYRISYDDIALYTISDIECLLAKGVKLRQTILNKRKKVTFTIFENNKKPIYFYGADAMALLNLALRPTSEELEGQVASRGNKKKISGRVRVVLNPGKEKFKDGEILVTSMTRVEFVPYMRRAKAIITDEGGVGSHAAIVSRELGIPCIIGTKTATRTLKTGDMVEMDMKTGKIKLTS